MARKNAEKKEEPVKEPKKIGKIKDEDDENSELEELMQGDSLLAEDDEFEDEELIGEIDEEDEEKEVMKHLKNYGKNKEISIVSVFEKIGRPKCTSMDKMTPDDFTEEYSKLIALLDSHSIIVHFKNDFPVKEKYRFIVEEVFKQDVEDFKKSKVQVSFIYEDFHPEMDEDDDEDFDYDYKDF
jgi:hypothetical protein